MSEAATKILVLGATGLLGQALMREHGAREVVGLSSQDTDIRDARRVAQVIRQAQPRWVILSAAYTNVDGCETNQELAFAVNTQGASNVAEAARDAGAQLLFVSTDYVFDGTKTSPYEVSDPRNPLNVYGRTKAEAEERLLEIDSGCCIVRTSWLFGEGGTCFPRTMLTLAAKQSQISVVNDQRGSPTYVVDLARAIYEMCDKQAHGIVHATNAGDCTWFDFAGEIFRQAGAAADVLPTTSDKFPRPAPRPGYSVLSKASLDSWGVRMPEWQDGLRRYLDARNAAE
ncbi:MAG: dTDP-4-dehydrorhamnose reductase [Acidobacteriales bacterium]|nr:dTDP-4-dehydrorhamnose reductase [Terriglobales bacterium]